MSNATDLPQSVLDSVEFLPIEDVALHVMRTYLPDITTYSLIPMDAPETFVLVRRDFALGRWGGRPGHLDYARLRVDAFTSDPDGDQKGALLSEAIRVAFLRAGEEELVLPNGDWIKSVEMTSEPARRVDWATATGPVQYADLPTGLQRYEAKYAIRVRKRPTPNP